MLLCLLCACGFAIVPLASSAAEVVLIGIAGPDSGIYSSQARAIKDGAAEAASVINAMAGNGGRTLTIMAVDDACDAAAAEQAARKFVAIGVALVLGHPCQSAAVAAAKIYAPANMLFIATATHVAALTEPPIGPTIVRLSAREDDQARDTASYLAALEPGAALLLVHDRTLYASTIVAGIEKHLAARPGGIGKSEIVASELAYDKVAATAATMRAGVVYFAGYPGEARLIRQALDKAGLGSVRFIVSDAAAAALFDIDRGRAVVMRMRHGLPADPSRPSPAATQIEDLQALAQTAVMLWASGEFGTVKSADGLNHPDKDRIGDREPWPSFEPFEWDGKNWQAAGPHPAASPVR